MSTISSSQALFRSDNPYEKLIQSIITIENQPKLKLVEQKTEEARAKGVLGDLDSKLSGLNTVLERLADADATFFDGRTAKGGGSGYSVSATDSAAVGEHSLEVQRLATRDARISQQYDAAATTLYDTYQPLGAQTFTVSVASSSAAAVDGLVDVDVTLDLSAETSALTNEEVLQRVSAAVDAAMDTAVSNGDIKNSERVSASVLNETSDTARLSLQSASTGYANRLRFADSANGLLAELQVNQETVSATATGGGAVVAVGTSESDSGLNSQFQLDGLTMYRSTNTVNDALQGITLSLKEVSEASTFSIERDEKAVKSEVDSFISKFNELLGYIKKKTLIDGETGKRGDLADDYSVRSLRYSLRSDAITDVTGQTAAGPQRLSDLGIEIKDDGTLSLDDADKLTDALADDPSSVQSLFSGADGVATRMVTRLESYLGSKGVINTRQNVISDRIERLEGRITRFEERMARREEQLRDQYARFQESIAVLQGQQNSLYSFMGYY